MVEVEFNYAGIITKIQSNKNDNMKDIYKKFMVKAGKNIDDLIFIYSGSTIIDDKLTFIQLANSEDKKRNKMSIIVNDYNNNNIGDKNDNLKKSKTIICPECQQNIKYIFRDYKITLFDCKNNHEIKDMLINEFEKSQLIDESKIICDECKDNDKSQTYKNKFYTCVDCKVNLCLLCKSKSPHDSHNIIDYDEKNFICYTHNEQYNSYCENCKMDLCLICEKEHRQHKTIPYSDIIPDSKLLKTKLNELRKKIDEYKKKIDEIIQKLNNIMENFEIYYNINDYIIKNYEKKNRNYSILQNMNNINNSIDKFIEKIKLNQKNIYEIFYNSIDIYEKMNNKDEKESTILAQEDKYKIYNWLYPIYKNIFGVKLKLIYQRGNDMSYLNFHQKCDNKGPTIVVCKSKNEKFGGYANISWESLNNERKFQNGPFIFSLTKNVKYEYQNKGNHSIYLDQNHGPDFSWDFTFNTSDEMKVCIVYPKEPGGYAYSSEPLIGNGYDQPIELDEVEVFQVIQI